MTATNFIRSLALLLLLLCGCSKQQPAAASRWKTSFNAQTWSVQHWSATGYRSWNLDWCDGFTADPKGELKAIVLTGPVAAPTGMRYGHRWVPRYWHSGYRFAQVSAGVGVSITTNGSVFTINATNGAWIKAQSAVDWSFGFTNSELISASMDNDVAQGWATRIPDGTTPSGNTFSNCNIVLREVWLASTNAANFTNWLARRRPDLYRKTFPPDEVRK